jgi:hypothetical protein
MLGSPPNPRHVVRNALSLMSAKGQKQTFAVQNGMSDRESGLSHRVMSALPLKANMCAANADVR